LFFFVFQVAEPHNINASLSINTVSVSLRSLAVFVVPLLSFYLYIYITEQERQNLRRNGNDQQYVDENV